ncbi:MAG: LuxR C-terminal-related transcriptional regulator [Anaerolineae bacterium]
MIRILIAAAYASVRAGFQALLASADDLTIVGEASGSAELERLLPDVQPDVVLYDYHEEDAARLVEVLSRNETGLGLVMLGEGRGNYQMLIDCPLRGWAYLLEETADGAAIVGAVRAVAAGLVVLDRSLASLLKSPALLAEQGLTATSDEMLTPREREVLQLMAQGLPNKAIAKRLHISLHTVKFHVASILGKLGASSRTEAVTLGARRGYVIL